jgi:phage tail-like protein
MRRLLFALCAILFLAAPGSTPPPTIAVYSLVVDGAEVAIFKSCQPFGSESEVIVSRVGGDSTEIKLPGRTSILNVTCSRGFTSSLELASWRALVENGDVSSARKNASLIASDATLQPVGRWNFVNAWPSSLTYGTGPNAGELIETFTLAVENMQRVTP